MGQPKIGDLVKNIVEPLLKKEEMELVDIEFKKEGGEWILRIFIDRRGGITLDDCQKISEKVGVMLDEANFISQSYRLEVSSPGLDRPLKTERDYLRNYGKLIRVSTYSPIANQKTLVGRLRRYSQDGVELEAKDGRIITIPERNIAKAQLEIEFE